MSPHHSESRALWARLSTFWRRCVRRAVDLAGPKIFGGLVPGGASVVVLCCPVRVRGRPVRRASSVARRASVVVLCCASSARARPWSSCAVLCASVVVLSCASSVARVRGRPVLCVERRARPWSSCPVRRASRVARPWSSCPVRRAPVVVLSCASSCGPRSAQIFAWRAKCNVCVAHERLVCAHKCGCRAARGLEPGRWRAVSSLVGGARSRAWSVARRFGILISRTSSVPFRENCPFHFAHIVRSKSFDLCVASTRASL
jgi:hypothetical protein